MKPILVALLLGWPLPFIGAQPLSPERLHREFNSVSFKNHAPARQPLDLANLDTNLLAAAVFHETNARRENLDLPPLTYHPGARQAAAIQARIMAERGSISHVNPKREHLRTLSDRLKAADLSPRFAAENVATAFAWQYESGKPFYRRKESGRTVVSYSPDGPAIPPHTYLSFAASLLDGWMNSPGHRKNILHEKAETLGAGCVPEKKPKDSAIPSFFCAQVFFTPLR